MLKFIADFIIDLVMVLEAFLTGRQPREKLQCLYENLMSEKKIEL